MRTFCIDNTVADVATNSYVISTTSMFKLSTSFQVLVSRRENELLPHTMHYGLIVGESSDLSIC